MTEPRNLPASSKYRATPQRAVDDAERESVNRRLNEAFATGAVDAPTYQALLDRVYAARTLGELEPVVAQLPVAASHDEPAIVVQGGRVAPGQLSPARPADALMRKLVVGISAGAVLVLVLAALILLLS